MGVGSRVGGWGQPGLYPWLTACVEASRLAVVWLPSWGGGRHFCGQGGGVIAAWHGGSWEEWKYYKGRVERGKG